MRPRFVALAASFALIAGLAFATTNFSTGPLPSYSGAPAAGGAPEESNCSVCHVRFDEDFNVIPNVNIPGGTVEIVSAPDTYVVDHEYPITVRLRSDSTAASPTRKWGFQFTAYRADDGTGAGTFIVPDPSVLQIVTGEPGGDWESRDYVEHTSLGTHTAEAGPVEWTFAWRAPASSVGTVHFAVAGNAADGTLDPGFDWIYTATDSAVDLATPTRAISWGSLKQRFR
jgi:hypothetical protein